MKKTDSTTIIFSSGKIITLPFVSRHSTGDIIDEKDNLLAKQKNPQDPQQILKLYGYYTKKFELIKRIKDFFLEKGFTEAITPKLKARRIQEANINLIKTDAGFLAPSPEVELKKLLVYGFDKIFELNWAYRDDFEDNLHKKEFLILEWYRSNSTPQAIINDFAKLTQYLCGQKILTYKNTNIDLTKTIYTSYKEAFLKFCNINIDKADPAKLKQMFNIEGSDDKLEILDAIFALKIEKNLGKNAVEIIYDFPKERVAFAKIENDLAKRYEIYMAGVEIGNCYLEENDPEEIKRRFKNQDPDFLKAMETGMPQASGIAVGVERLIMLILNRDSIW